MEIAASDDIIIDWKGRNMGTDYPQWAKLVASDPNDDLAALPRLRDKRPVPLSREGANLPVVEAWVNTQAYAECAQRIRTTAVSQSGTGLAGDLQSAEALALAQQFQALYAQADISGLNKELETWVKTRSKTTGIEKYTYYVIYAISDADLKESIARTFGKIEAKSQKERELKAEMESQMSGLISNAKF
jgi:hypothetical protein